MSVLRNRNFSILFSGQLVSSLGSSLFFLALPWYVLTLTHSKADLSITAVAQSIPGLFSLFAGVFVDRWDRRVTMVVSDGIRSLLLVGATICVSVHTSWIFLVVIVSVLQLVGTFFNPASSALLPVLIDKEEIATASGFMQSASAACQLLGTLAGGVLMSTEGPFWIFVTTATTFFLSAASLLFIRVPARAEAPVSRQSFLRDLTSGFKYLKRSKFVFLILASAVVANFAFAPFETSTTAWIKEGLHGTAMTLGITNAVFFVGIILGGVLLGLTAKALSFRIILMFGLLISGFCAFVFQIVPHAWWVCTLLFIMGFAISSLNGVLNASLQKYVSTEFRGRVFGALSSMATICMPLGMTVGGLLIAHFPLVVTYVSIGCFNTVAALVMCLPIRNDLALLSDDEQGPTVQPSPAYNTEVPV